MTQHALNPGKTMMNAFIRPGTPKSIGMIPEILNGLGNGVNPGNPRVQPMLNQASTLQLPPHAIKDVVGIEPAWMPPQTVRNLTRFRMQQHPQSGADETCFTKPFHKAVSGSPESKSQLVYPYQSRFEVNCNIQFRRGSSRHHTAVVKAACFPVGKGTFDSEPVTHICCIKGSKFTERSDS
ncbi:hypothetical protein [Arthrobacter sp. AET 35A]|uniref:hypothetical protein n=1 Tax=Arthrobacter sp. AET 35A TaxID=2292643 RepID=UPI001CE2C0D8|nr:hypothetical protein [Arthrobacter sp. AET 35A]